MNDEETVPRDGIDDVVDDAKAKAKEAVEEMTGPGESPTRAATQ